MTIPIFETEKSELVEEKEVDPDTLLTTMGLAAGSVVLVLLASLAL